MTPERGLKRYYWELSTFVSSESTTYKDIKQNS